MKLTAAIASAALIGAAGTAHADRREASLHAHLLGGTATAGDENAEGSASTPVGGLAIRASYATSNTFQYDVALSLLATGAAGFEAGTFMPPGKPVVSGPFEVSNQLTRLDGGATLRLGVVWIPTVRLAAGVQTRRRTSPVVMSNGDEVTGEDNTGRPDEIVFDLVGVGTVGLDHRINRRLIVGVAVGASYAVPLGGEAFRTFEGTAHVAYYWYPR